MIYNFYQKVAPIDVTQLFEENALRYRYWIDTCRRMQTIIDNDNGKDSPEAQVTLRALRALLVGSSIANFIQECPQSILCALTGQSGGAGMGGFS
jgi:hypothetical protein